MYILLNREDIVVDILPEVRYTKLQSSKGIIVACEEDEGTGVIGSDCNTQYVLIKADRQNSPDAVSVLELKEIPSEIKPNLYKYDRENQKLVYRYSLKEVQDLKQKQNKTLFAEYLENHPLTWTDGKAYGITLEDQTEITMNINQYQAAERAGAEYPVLEWHAKGEENVPWSLTNLSTLLTAISDAVYPKYKMMQKYKVAIYNTASIEELEGIELSYK